MSVFSKIAKHFPLEHGAPNAMMPGPDRILEDTFGEPFKLCTYSCFRETKCHQYINEQILNFDDYHWVLTQSTFNRSKIVRGDVDTSPIRIERYGKTIFILDGHHRYLDKKYFKKESGVLAYGYDCLTA